MAEKWKISPTMVIRLARNGKIPGSQLIGNSWAIPADAQKPERKKPRTSAADTTAANSTAADTSAAKAATTASAADRQRFVFPLMFLNNYTEEDINNFTPEEKLLYRGQLLYCRCRMEESKAILEELLKTTENIYIKIGTLYILTYAYIITGEYRKVERTLFSVKLIYEKEFERKAELQFINTELSAILNTFHVIMTPFDFDFTENRSKISEYYLMLELAFADALKVFSRSMEINPNIYELICDRFILEGYTAMAVVMSFYIGCMFLFTSNNAKARFYLRQAIDLSIKSESYAPLINYSFTCYSFFESILDEYPSEFREFFKKYHLLFQSNYKIFMEQARQDSYFNSLTDEDYKYINYAVARVPNKEIADLEHLSESTINKKFLAIYDKLGVSGKKDLSDLALSSMIGKDFQR